MGVYLITGGLGKVGLILGEYLARTLKARLVFTGRSEFPERNDWETWIAEHTPDDPVSRKIRAVRLLEELGAKVLVLRAEAEDEAQMRSVVQQAEIQFGAIHGVIHAAGTTQGALAAITTIDRAHATQQFKPKVQGLYVLDRIFRDKDLDFCVLVSSNAAILGGLGMGDYSAANLFMDAFALSRSKRRESWISTNWDPWPNEARRSGEPRSSLDQYRMTSEESVEAFRRVVSMAPSGQVIIATGDLQARLDLWLKGSQLEASKNSAGANLSSGATRPSLTSTYAAPRNDMEQIVCKIWTELLGYDRIGVNDNFFELGGHSLIALQIVSRIRERFDVEIPLKEIFSQPTVAHLVEVVEQRILSEVEELTEAEAEQLLHSAS
jgi:acyl carrier protein/NAD(P)-dependent dehydrogenase (short-subunit alcohol dehydrogenase family)